MHFKGFVRGTCILVIVASSAQLLSAQAPKEITNARIDDIAANFTSLTVTDCASSCDGKLVNISVRDTAAQKELKNFKKGDHVSAQLGNDNGQSLLQTISIRALPVSSGTRILVLVVTAAVYFFITALLAKFHPLSFVLGLDKRYSNSKVQLALWFSVVIITYIAAIYLRAAEAGAEFLGGVNIPQNLLLMSGMSALTFGGAKGITTSKVNSAVQARLTSPKTSASAPSFWNLVQNDDGFFDIGDFQMLVVTLLAAGMYLVLVFNFLGSVEMRKVADLPNVDTTILAAFGLGHGAYLAKKAAGNAGDS